jgi:hypothetical protein
MKRKALLAIAAGAAVAAIVVLTTTAFGGTGAPSDQPGDLAAFISCLASHGVQVPSDDPAAVKQWLGQRSQDPVVQAALNACAGGADTGGDKTGGGNGTEAGPTPAELVGCLERHRVDVPSGVKEAPDTLKAWLVGVMDQPSVSSAVEDCTGGPPPDGQKK